VGPLQGVKRQGHEIDDSTASKVEAMNDTAIPPLLHISSQSGQGHLRAVLLSQKESGRQSLRY
jgi:hypothetical protein